MILCRLIMMSTWPGADLNRHSFQSWIALHLYKEVRLKQRTEPWMNSEILNDIRERDNILHILIKTVVRKICLGNTKNLEIKSFGILKRLNLNMF